MWNRNKERSKDIHYQGIGNIFFGCFLSVTAILAILGVIFIHKKDFRLDQYATTILGTTAGIVGTMFGLTAASYAFIWGDLRSDSQENRHLGKVLECYGKKLWHLFIASLSLTVLVVFTSLIGLALAQNITNPSLYKIRFKSLGLISEYKNDEYFVISILALFNLLLSLIAVGSMAWMNWVVFKRNTQYAAIAKSILIWIQQKYNMELSDGRSENIGSIEYEKIHNLEILMERILKNHESIGNAFAESQRREKLLIAVITNELEASYNVGNNTDEKNCKAKDDTVWKYLEEGKRESRWKQCYQKAVLEYKMLTENGEEMPKIENLFHKPCECSFITVYDDLLLYRDNSLVWEEKHKEKRYIRKVKKTKQKDLLDIFKQRALRYTIKKRLLIFYLRGEVFSNMDLSGVSFSGADLRCTNFVDCNLTKIRLKGSNCEGADFSRSKMAGMYFDDVLETEENEIGEIQLSCRDVSCGSDTEEAWNPYRGREATCFQDATFKEADVSRAYLKAPGDLEGEQVFPYGVLDENVWKLEEGHVVFSLTGTNFDCAKMFFSYFKNIDFTNSSLEKAQMYNVGMVQTKAKSTNFAAVTLTNACIAWCDFENANFSDASLAETIIIRANFSGANMKNVNFSYSNIVACNFEGASCQNASFKNMTQDLKKIKDLDPKALRGVDLNEAKGLSFTYATLTNTDFSGAELDNISFSNAVGQGCIFTKVTGKSIVFDSAIFNSSVFNSVKFQSSSLQNTVLQNSVFIDLQFINSFFYKTDFSGSLFEKLEESCILGGCMCEVDLSDTKGLTASCFSRICLKEVDFRGTGLKEEDFKKDVKIIKCKF